MSSKSSVFNSNSELTINHFTVKEQIGSGKFGIVYRAVARYSERDVAIKIVSKKTVEESTLYKQLQREVEIHSKLKHPFVCELYAYFHDARNIYLVLEYCPHGSLYAPSISNVMQSRRPRKSSPIRRSRPSSCSSSRPSPTFTSGMLCTGT